MFSVVDNEAGHSGNAALIDSVVVSLADIIIIFQHVKGNNVFFSFQGNSHVLAHAEYFAK